LEFSGRFTRTEAGVIFFGKEVSLNAKSIDCWTNIGIRTD